MVRRKWMLFVMPPAMLFHSSQQGTRQCACRLQGDDLHDQLLRDLPDVAGIQVAEFILAAEGLKNTIRVPLRDQAEGALPKNDDHRCANWVLFPVPFHLVHEGLMIVIACVECLGPGPSEDRSDSGVPTPVARLPLHRFDDLIRDLLGQQGPDFPRNGPQIQLFAAQHNLAAIELQFAHQGEAARVRLGVQSEVRFAEALM
mmetsp:Transcript_105514/g.303420  ORF Transcript_105514/g.303420 Transcript_105514/m.303420 type:complete len:201 (+) Transcript_105514:471-1073(+)